MLQPSTSDKDQSSRSSNSHFFNSSSILTKAFKSLKDKIAEKGHYIALPLFGRLVHSVQEAPTHQHLSTMGSTKTGSSRSSSAAYWSASSEKLLRQAVSLSPFLAQYILKGPVCRKKLQFWWFLSFWPSMFDSQRSQRNESRLWPRSQIAGKQHVPEKWTTTSSDALTKVGTLTLVYASYVWKHHQLHGLYMGLKSLYSVGCTPIFSHTISPCCPGWCHDEHSWSPQKSSEWPSTAGHTSYNTFPLLPAAAADRGEEGLGSLGLCYQATFQALSEQVPD